VTYQWENLHGYDFLYAGPLFVHQFSHAWIDFRGIQDRFMRENRCDYFENSRRATEVQREYGWRNPHGFAGYDESCWGITACDGPSQQLPELAGETLRLFGYAARGVPHASLARADWRAWVSAGLFGLDQGIVLLMIENHRTELIWQLMQNCVPIRTGLARAGFRGGWLSRRASNKEHANARTQ
jgi:hypothetical protein